MPTTSATAGTMLLRSEEDLSATRILISSSSEDEKSLEVKPFLPRALSFNNTTTAATTNNSNYYKKRRRRIASDTSLSSLSGSGHHESFGPDDGHAASDKYLITRLSFKLLRYIGVGYRWIKRFLALGCYSFLIMPGFLQVAYYYFFSSQVRRGIVYGDQPRNSLDLYLPKNSDGPKPVVAFVTGGAWIIGYKAWGSLLGQQLSERDIIVACIDYRNFPQGTMSDMVKDASQGISFVCNNIAEYGGDPNRIYLMGQSAGAHIAACALLEQAIKESGGESLAWTVSQIKAYFGLSGGYNLFNLVDHFHSRGLYRSIFLSIMEGEQSLRQFSPEVMVQDPDIRNAVLLLPPIILFHGTADYSIPSDSSKTFAETLQRVGVKAESILYEGKTHTDLFLQDPMRGGKDEMFENLVAIIHAGDAEALAKDAMAPPRKRLVPEFMLKLAHNYEGATKEGGRGPSIWDTFTEKFPGIQPFVTLFHWDLPQALEDEYGGFLSPKIVADFCDYVELCYKEFGDRVKHWITLNEPLSLSSMAYAEGKSAPGRCSEWMARNCLGGDSSTEPYIVGHNQLLAHAAAVKVYKDKYQASQNGQIGIVVSVPWMVPYDQSEKSYAAANRTLEFMYGWFMEPLKSGTYPAVMVEYVKQRLPKFTEEQSSMVKGSFDFIGVNYYSANYVFDVPCKTEELSYSTDPCINRYGGTKWDSHWSPGIGEYDIKKSLQDSMRVDYYHSHLLALQRAIKDGVDVRGFFAWSLLDNFQWRNGYTVRFGIVQGGLHKWAKKIL
ncbi:hypothetical protein F0562_032812 [Nyssa sinensis]|uniref:protein-S-isoprenylcysteine alpha-carbonyl methylesterase n=1 Tax=Nyssa sinensis TaxID=561372 RepID=A0A5J5AR78_9ASTE|nr:hypothetical protein F0562_032812 [Nyssa sinensis]